MAETKETLLKLVNASGFLFQKRIEKEIQIAGNNGQIGNWEIAAHEHRWFEVHEKNDFFIDLILKSGFSRIVMECKRAINANWIFLVPDGKRNTYRTRIMWTQLSHNNLSLSEWHEFQVKPLSPEAEFCIVRGQGEKDTPMLERISSLVMRSVESLAEEELRFTNREDINRRLYFPMIVTNASLHICRFKSDSIDISTGEITDADFEQVPCVRFRKNFSSSVRDAKPQTDLEQSNQMNDRTVLVVNSSNLISTLQDWDVPYGGNNPWPWEV